KVLHRFQFSAAVLVAALSLGAAHRAVNLGLHRRGHYRPSAVSQSRTLREPVQRGDGSWRPRARTALGRFSLGRADASPAAVHLVLRAYRSASGVIVVSRLKLPPSQGDPL